jgi:hypothetical protein
VRGATRVGVGRGREGEGQGQREGKGQRQTSHWGLGSWEMGGVERGERERGEQGVGKGVGRKTLTGMEIGCRETRGSCVEEEDSLSWTEVTGSGEGSEIARGRQREKATEVRIETTPENTREHIL